MTSVTNRGILILLAGLTLTSGTGYATDIVTAQIDNSPSVSTPIWTVNLGPYDTPSDWLTGLGVLSTPVISRAWGAMFVVAATNVSGSRVYSLHALDLLTGAEKFGGPVVINGSVTGTTSDAQSGVITFNPGQHIQRTSLAIAGNNIVVAFASDRDHGPYHGWVFTYDRATLQQTGIYNDARDTLFEGTYGSGIWQSGRAPAVDSSNAIYFETGNGDYDGTGDFGMSVLKLQAGRSGLSLLDWFTPNNWESLNYADYDLSSTGPTLIPNTSLFFAGAKSGVIYLMSTSNLGKISSGDSNIIQSFTATTGCVTPYVFQGCAQIMGQVFWATAPVPTLYIWGVHDVLRAFQFTNGTFNTVPVSVGSSQSNYPGGVMTMSSFMGEARTGIIWAITEDTPDNGFYFGPGFTGTATLHAYNATNVTQDLWNSDQNPMRDTLGEFASFTPPIAVNGKVYTPTFSNQLVVYGLLNGPVTGDVNGDSKVDCADMAIVRNAFGKSTSQPGYDLRADMDHDGVISIVDLAIVSGRVPAGSVCR